MKTHLLISATAVSALAFALLLGGCDRELSHTSQTKVKSDGTVESKDTVVKQAPDGTITKEETEKKTTSPNP